MVHTFRSTINSEKYMFIYDTGKWDNSPIAPYFLYQTARTDGTWVYPQPLPTHLVGEYLISLATEMRANDELIESLKYKLPHDPDDSMLEFAAGVVYKEGKKKRYFSREFARVSSVKAKQYDRRWQEITPEMNGSPSSMLDFMLTEYNRDGLTRYIYARKLRKWLYENKATRRRYIDMDLPAEFIGWTKDRHENYAIDAAWNNVEIALNIYEQKRNFKNNIDQYTQNAMVSKLEN